MDFVEVPVSEDVPSKKGKVKKEKRKTKRTEETDGKGTETEAAEAPGSSDSSLPPTFSLSEIKNKQRRHLMFMKLKQEKRKVKWTDI